MQAAEDGIGTDGIRFSAQRQAICVNTICTMCEAVHPVHLVYHDQNAPVSHQFSSARSAHDRSWLKYKTPPEGLLCTAPRGSDTPTETLYLRTAFKQNADAPSAFHLYGIASHLP
jgi:hypothetical protein